MSTQPHASDVLVFEYPEITGSYCLRVVCAIAGGRPVGTIADADDLAQETALRFHLFALREKAQGRIIRHPKQALRQIARHVYAEYLRKRKRDERLYAELQLQQHIQEIPFLSNDQDEIPPIKREFLSRARRFMSPEDKRLFDVTYAPERRTMAEQAEILQKTLRAHTLQKNRFFARLHKVRGALQLEVIDRIALSCKAPPPFPNQSLNNDLKLLAVTDDERSVIRMLLLFYNALLLSNALKGNAGKTPLRSDPSHRAMLEAYLAETCRYLPRPDPQRRFVQDYALRAVEKFAIGRVLICSTLETPALRDAYRSLNVRSAALTLAYGNADVAERVLTESAGFLNLLGWPETIDSMRERMHAEDLSRYDPYSSAAPQEPLAH